MKARLFLKQLLIVPVALSLLIGCSQGGQVTAPVPAAAQATLPAEDQFEVVRKAADEYLSRLSETSVAPDKVYQEYVQGKNPQYLLVDIRATDDFIANNIRGSINIPYAQTANVKKLANLPKDKTLVVIDYNGHWAAQTAATWNMLGYKAVPLLYGLQSWTKDGVPLGYDEFPADALQSPLVTEAVALGQYSTPELKLTPGKVEEIVRILTGSYLDRNYKGFITAEDLLAKLQDGTAVNESYIVDVRQASHYQLGHIQGSVNIPIAQLAKTDMLKSLPLDKKIILIGYDGIEASQGARVLVTLGYDAVALKYGISYWNGDQQVTGASPLHSLVKDEFVLTPLNYAKPSTGAAGCG